jgi:hypothetical protein
MATPTVLPILPINTEGQELTFLDESNISNISVQSRYNVDTDYIQAYLYDIDDNLITRLTTNYSVTSGKISGSSTTQLSLDPSQDLLSNNYTQGTYKINYNFLHNLIEGNPLFNIVEISSDRTELRVSNSSFNSQQLQQITTTLTAFLNSTEAFEGFYLDFGSNNILLATNVGSDSTAVLIKLYQALPDTFAINSAFNFVQKKSEPVAYIVDFPQEEIETLGQVYLKGPNLNIQVQQENNNSTEFQTLGSIYSSSNINLTNQLNSILVERRAELNTDYTEFINFVFFSSAEQRLINFYEKASLIENYNTQIANLNTIPNSTEASSSKAVYQSKINNLVTNFDGYDYFLYFNSESKSWPKSNSTEPYTLYSTGSAQVLTWYSEQLNSASLYDNQNQNYIYNIYPTFITEDVDNDQFKLFNEMVAQMFDQIWLYTQAIENRQDGDNRLSEGISIDLAADALRSYGIKLYESNFSNSDLYTTYLGINPAGGTLPPTGSELITTYVTASAETTPFNDAQKLIYKRLYHNLPYLLKKKGTVAGLQLLIDCFGVPDTVLRVYEYGGKDKNTTTWDQWQNSFDYNLYTSGSTFVSSSWALNTLWSALDNVPQAVEFRFKTDGLPQNTSSIAVQSLWSTADGAGSGVAVNLRYNGSGFVSGSYSGSVVNQYQTYGYLDFYPDITSTSNTASIYLPFFDGGWWSVMVNKNNGGSSTTFQLVAKNKPYNGEDGNILGFQASSSVVGNDGLWNSTQISYLATSSILAPAFTGSLQEWRYYATQSSQDTFNAYVMNPSSIEESDYLAFRASLGGELYTSSISIHPKVSGIQAITSSFASTSNYFIKGTPLYIPNTEVVFYDQVLGGIKNVVSEKIKIGGSTLYGTVLSGMASMQQNYPASQSYTNDVNYMEVGFSPANEINEDINSQLGYINIGEYIGDPRFVSQSSYTYPDLVTVSNNYFKKYGSSYDLQDYFRLIKYFDNSLFKMIKDFIPARASAATGAIVKQHLLERNRQRPAQMDYTQPEYTGSVTSLARDYQTGSIEVFTGGPGGSVNAWLNISQSWSSSINTKAGIVNTIQSSEYEFYNGEYSGSNIPCHLSYSLNTTPLLNNVSGSRLSTLYEDIDYSSDAFSPVNLIYIQSGSASLAPVQDSNYAHTSSWTIARYEGSQNTGIYNTAINFASESQAPGYPIDKFSNYFARFSYTATSDPEYPNGGLFKLVELINIDGTRIPLLGDNKYVEYVSEVFKKGKTVTAYGRDVSTIKTLENIPVVEGGGIYKSIVVATGSATTFINSSTTSGTSQGFTISFTGSSGLILADSKSVAENNTSWLYSFTNRSSSVGVIDYFYFSTFQEVTMFNKNTGLPVNSSTTPNTITYQDTYLPLQYGDYIRFGNLGPFSNLNTGSLDGSFSALGLFNIRYFVTGSNNNVSSSVVLANTTADYPQVQYQLRTPNSQNFRIFRRVPDETYVVTSINANMNVDPTVGGLLVPEDFNPGYDPISVARQAGIEL